jgi:methyl-accepting chemotaxis protein
MAMNRLLKGIAIYLVIAVLLSLVAVSSIHSRILINGELLGHEILSQEELKVFYDAIGDYIDIRQKLRDMNYKSIMNTDIGVINNYLEDDINEILAIYDREDHWSSGSDQSLDLEMAKRRHRRDSNVVTNLLLPPIEFGEYLIFDIETTDEQNLSVVMIQCETARMIFNKYSTVVYRIQWIGIILSLIVSFLPIIINMIFNYYIPLKRLQNATELIAEGDLNFSIESQGLDEIKSLSRAFEHMRHELERRSYWIIESNLLQIFLMILGRLLLLLEGMWKVC